MTRAALGDSHNFGRRVTLRGKRVHKPRALLWEWLVLCRESPLRGLLAELAERDGLGPDTFAFLPSLRFYPARDQGFQEVEAVALEPLRARSQSSRRALAEITGRALALFSWLGVADLHWENLVLGSDPRGHVVFAPLDVEMILSDLSLPTETKLLPDADPEYAAVCQHACGVRRVLPYLGKPVAPADLVAMLAAYHAVLALLERHSRELARVFAELPELGSTPIRVCLRGTDEYVLARSSQDLWPPLLDAEAEQLARGDIPYFFRLYGQKRIYHYADPELTRLAHLPARGDVPRLEPLLSVARGLRSPNREKLRTEGLFSVLGAFDHPAFTGQTHEQAGLEVAFRPRGLRLTLPSGEQLESRRNLSAYVSSVYQPCRCGEVRSVFVPAVTRCNESGRAP
ncbi:MAG: type 2 lanthipeptide synthetase LanM [Myxococcota bacterium]|nr:type 2 lanthipeptide synthetase LanM [Myxococcota bacterium]